MATALLNPARAAELRAADLTYPEVGRTRLQLPSGYTLLSETSTLHGSDFAATAAALLAWQLHERAGIRVTASSERIEVRSVAVLRLGTRWLGLDAPCRVVYVVDEPGRRGFAYGTLPGHPESGEESFVLSIAADGQIHLAITAFSRPATFLARAAGPVGRAAQKAMTTRYLRALDR